MEVSSRRRTARRARRSSSRARSARCWHPSRPSGPSHAASLRSSGRARSRASRSSTTSGASSPRTTARGSCTRCSATWRNDASTAPGGSERSKQRRSRSASSTARRTPSRALTWWRATASSCRSPTSSCSTVSATIRRSRIPTASRGRSSSFTIASERPLDREPFTRRRSTSSAASVTPHAFDPATLDVMSPEHFEQHGYPHAEWTWLRRNAPIFWYDRPNVEPFWAITKHADIVEISKQPQLFLNAPRLAVFTRDLPPPPEGTVRHLLNMDPPDHARHRRLSSSWFTPRAIRGMDEKVARVTGEIIDQAAAMTTGDFVQEISARITIAVIAEMLGVPRSDWELLFRWTNEVIAPQDPEFQRGATAEETGERARFEVFAYFNELAERRRKEPSDDIVSVVANGKLDGAPLPPVELLSYYFLLVVAGNETTRNAMTGGLLAFLEHPCE